MHTVHRLPVVVFVMGDFPVEFLLRIHQVVVLQVGSLNIHVAVIGNAHLSAFGPDGLDNHDAVTGFGTVDGFGGRIFQQGDALHAVHVEIEHLFQRRFESVKNEQRLIGVSFVIPLNVERGLSAQLNVGQGVRVGTHFQVFGNLKRRIQYTKTFQQVLVAHRF